MKRLLFILGLILCIAAPLQDELTSSAHGANAAKDTILSAIDDVVAILRSGDYSDPAKKDALAAQLKPIMDTTFDFEEMSMRTVGRSWRTFTKAQQTEFAQLFAKLLTETYLDRIQQYTDEKVEFVGERTSKRGNVEIETRVVMGGKDIPIAYRMTDNGRWVVYDVLVEGVSLVKNYRSQFQEILVNGTAEDLISALRNKVTTIRSTAN